MDHTLQEPRKVAHIGIAVRSISDVLPFYRDALGLEVTEIIESPERGLRIALLPCGDSVLELMEPSNEGSQISKFLKRRGPGIHHICFEVVDLEGKVSEMLDAGVRLVNPQPEIGAEGLPVVFVHPAASGGVLYELVEEMEP